MQQIPLLVSTKLLYSSTSQLYYLEQHNLFDLIHSFAITDLLSHPSTCESHLDSNAMPPKNANIAKNARKRDPGGPYICALCNRGFTRRATVKEPHFASCVARHGNPNQVAWDDHESCWPKKPGRKLWLPGAAAPSAERKSLGEEESEDGGRDGANDEVDEGQDVRSSNESQAKNWSRTS